ncbi:hypothetical protein HUJ04_001655, partial [Dendroctonus ponderosae]
MFFSGLRKAFCWPSKYRVFLAVDQEDPIVYLDESSEFHDTLDANRNSKRPQSWGSRSIVFRTYSEKPDLEELHGLFKVELEVDDSSMILIGHPKNISKTDV